MLCKKKYQVSDDQVDSEDTLSQEHVAGELRSNELRVSQTLAE